MKMQKAEMKFIRFEAEDVITTSGGNDPYVTFAGFGDYKKSTNTISFSGVPYTYGTDAQFKAKLQEVFKTDKINLQTYISPNVRVTDVDDSMAMDLQDGEDFNELNGTWKWINEQFQRVSQ